jgi:hypothetical protein
MRMSEPRSCIVVAVLLLCFVVGLWTSRPWMMVFSVAVGFAILLFVAKYILTSPRNFCGIDIRLSVREDGLHFSSPNRSGTVGWAGFREIYILKEMWALFFKNSESVTMIPTDQLSSDTLNFMVARLRENQVKIHGDT